MIPQCPCRPIASLCTSEAAQTCQKRARLRKGTLKRARAHQSELRQVELPAHVRVELLEVVDRTLDPLRVAWHEKVVLVGLPPHLKLAETAQRRHAVGESARAAREGIRASELPDCAAAVTVEQTEHEQFLLLVLEEKPHICARRCGQRRSWDCTASERGVEP